MKHFLSYIRDFHLAFSQVWINVAAISLVGLIFQEDELNMQRTILGLIISVIGITFHLGIKRLVEIRIKE